MCVCLGKVDECIVNTEMTFYVLLTINALAPAVFLSSSFYVCVYVCTRMCLYVYLCVYVSGYKYNIYIYIYIYIYGHFKEICMSLYMYACIYIYIYIERTRYTFCHRLFQASG